MLASLAMFLGLLTAFEAAAVERVVPAESPAEATIQLVFVADAGGLAKPESVRDDREPRSTDAGLLKASVRKAPRRLAQPRALARSPSDPGNDFRGGFAVRRTPVPDSVQVANVADLKRLCRRLL